MSRENTYSINRLLSAFFALFSIALLSLSAFYFSSFSSMVYADSLSWFQERAEDNADELKQGLQTSVTQLSWFSTMIENNDYWASTNSYERLLHLRNLSGNLRGLMVISPYTDAVLVSQVGSDVILESHILDEEVFLKFLDKYNRRRIAIPSSFELFWATEGGEPSHLVLRRPINAYDQHGNFTRSIASAYMALRLETLLPPPEMGELCLLCIKEGGIFEVLYSANGVRQVDALALDGNDSESTITIEGIEYLISVHDIDYGGLSLVLLQSKKPVVFRNISVLVKGSLLMVLTLVVAGLGIVVISKRIRRPVRDITDGVQRISTGDYTYRLPSGRAEEIRTISDGINSLLDELHRKTQQMVDTQKNLYEVRLLHKESQMMALQFQINPHFLYNTLEMVSSMARSGETAGIPKILSDMTKIYRYSVSNSSMGTIGSEFECAICYMEIMKNRFGSSYSFTYRMDDSVGEIAMPRMVLQPLVENAINHGLAMRESGGTVSLSCTREGTCACFTISDNGVGMGSGELEALKAAIEWEIPKGGIGMHNVHQRLKRVYGPGHGLQLVSELGEGTTVTFSIPLDTGKEDVS